MSVLQAGYTIGCVIIAATLILAVKHFFALLDIWMAVNL